MRYKCVSPCRLSYCLGSRIDEVDVKLAVRAMIGMVMGFLFLYKIEGEASPARGASARHVAEGLADLVLNGFRTRTGNGRRPQ